MIQDFKTQNIQGTILHYAHSQGGAITESALKQLTPEERKYIHVKTFGSASLFSKNLAASVIHYVSMRDPVPMTDIVGYIKAVFSTTFGLSTPVQFVGNLRGMPFADHSWQGDTYWSLMKDHGDAFRAKYYGEQ